MKKNTFYTSQIQHISQLIFATKLIFYGHVTKWPTTIGCQVKSSQKLYIIYRAAGLRNFAESSHASTGRQYL